MKKEDFFEELVDILELEEDNISPKTELSLDSMSILSLIAFLDENFNIKSKADQLGKIESVNDIIKIVGKDNIQ